MGKKRKGKHSPGALPAIYEKYLREDGISFYPPEIDELERLVERKELSSKALFEYIVSRFLLNQYPEIKNCLFSLDRKNSQSCHFLERIIHLYPRFQVLHILRHPCLAIFFQKT